LTDAAHVLAQFHTEWFGRVADGVVLLNDIGTIADEQWQWLGQQYQYVDLGPYVILPDHIHALIGHGPIAGETATDGAVQSAFTHA